MTHNLREHHRCGMCKRWDLQTSNTPGRRSGVYRGDVHAHHITKRTREASLYHVIKELVRINVQAQYCPESIRREERDCKIHEEPSHLRVPDCIGLCREDKRVRMFDAM